MNLTTILKETWQYHSEHENCVFRSLVPYECFYCDWSDVMVYSVSAQKARKEMWLSHYTGGKINGK